MLNFKINKGKSSIYRKAENISTASVQHTSNEKRKTQNNNKKKPDAIRKILFIKKKINI